MSFYVIKGNFHIKGFEPDADSVKFLANDLQNWKKLKPTYVKISKDKKLAQLRFEAIDALETHYEGHHQPWELATYERAEMLLKLNITDIKWDDKEIKVIDANDNTEGFIVASAVEAYHRPVSFVFTGELDKEDGTEIVLDKKLAKTSINFKLIQEGLAYPTYYENFSSELIKTFNSAVKKARTKNKGIWAVDKTNSGVNIQNMNNVTENEVILPKLFRRIVTHLDDGGEPAGFKEFLNKKGDKVKTLKSDNWVTLDEIVKVDGDTVKLTEKPENLIFKET